MSVDIKKIAHSFHVNWLYPTLGAVIAAVGDSVYQMWEDCGQLLSVSCFDEVELARVAGFAAFGFLATKFKALGGKSEPWFDHKKV